MSDQHDEYPAAYIHRLYESQTLVENLLDMLNERLSLGEYETARTELRDLAMNDPELFDAIMVVLEGTHSLFAEVEADVDDSDRVDYARQLSEQYARLEYPFQIVWAENQYGLWNPQVSHEARVRYDAEYQLPMLAYELYSGQQELATFTHRPSTILSFIENLLDSLNTALMAIQNEGHPAQSAEVTAITEAAEAVSEAAIDVKFTADELTLPVQDTVEEESVPFGDSDQENDEQPETENDSSDSTTDD